MRAADYVALIFNVGIFVTYWVKYSFTYQLFLYGLVINLLFAFSVTFCQYVLFELYLQKRTWNDATLDWAEYKEFNYHVPVADDLLPVYVCGVLRKPQPDILLRPFKYGHAFSSTLDLI